MSAPSTRDGGRTRGALSLGRRRSAPRFGAGDPPAPGVLRRHDRLRRRRARAHDVLAWLRDDPGQRFDYLTDVTAVEYRDPERPLEVVWQLRSLAAPRRPPGQGRARQDAAARGATRCATSGRAPTGWSARCTTCSASRFRGHPDLRRILMWETYAEGFPLRKDFPLRGHFSRAEQTRQALAANPEAHYSLEELSIADAYDELPADMRERLARGERGDGRMSTRTVDVALATPGLDARGRSATVPLGVAAARVSTPRPRRPRRRAHADQHRAAAPGHARRAAAGARARRRDRRPRASRTSATCTRGFEKLGEYRHYNQIIPLTDRTDYLSPDGEQRLPRAGGREADGHRDHASAAQVLRVIACEMSRIISHLVWLGTTGIDLGAFTPFLWAF